MLDNRNDGPENLPHDIRRYCGNVAIILANNNFVSFAAGSRTYGLALVAIKGSRSIPFHLPNVTQNVIAHELGHILGLRHNADLRPPCRLPTRQVLFRNAQDIPTRSD